MSDRITLIDGDPADCVEITDRAFQFGDGLFETLRVDGGRARFVRRHLTRCVAGCARLGIAPPAVEAMLADIAALAARIGTGTVKLIVTRGSSERGYAVPTPTRSRRVVSAWPGRAELPASYRVRLCETRLANQPLLAGIKHLNRLEQVLARREWSDPAVHEGLLLDYAGNLIEGTLSNLFLIRDRRVRTPDLAACGVAGVLRSVVLDAAQALGFEVTVDRVTPDDLRAADEVFLCNTLAGVRPVTEWIGETDYPVGPVTTTLHQAVERLAADDTGDRWHPR